MFPLLNWPDGLSAERFLAEYWQRKPLLIRQALPGFESPISPDELAGLACEEGIESRIVRQAGDQDWLVAHGPFAEGVFAELPEDHWTLLVQDADKHLPEVHELLERFRFLPDWRLDDIMISWAEDQGSVGPHVDEYDVFLIQALGRRRWQVDPRPRPNAPFLPDQELRILGDFDAREDWVLEPGDLLYLPPNVPHWGLGEGGCMTWSVGLRAPAWSELATAWCDHEIERVLSSRRYGDPGLSPQAAPGEILPEVFDEARRVVREALSQADEASFRAWLGAWLSEPKEHLQVEPLEDKVAPEDLRRRIEGGGLLERSGLARLAFAQDGAEGLLFFANGTARGVPTRLRPLVELLTDQAVLGRDALAEWGSDPQGLALLCQLINEGHHGLID